MNDESKSDMGDDDEILTNSMYVIVDIQEVDGYRLIYLINYWNRGKWNRAFGPEDEAWETNKGLKEKLEYEVAPDGTFWMLYEDWLKEFNTLYYCRLFPHTWSQYSLPGMWTGMTSGGGISIYNIKHHLGIQIKHGHMRITNRTMVNSHLLKS